MADPVPYPKHREPLRGEDHALVRPYMVAHEERVRRRDASRRRTLIVQPYAHLPETG
ncbi:hypothetical protein ACFCXP_03470 [Streptomyces niveus]|uniref:hypothetical protein n=1 Tax=Streptomyces niveus TaxID=193462 RepID=UPI0035D9F616